MPDTTTVDGAPAEPQAVKDSAAAAEKEAKEAKKKLAETEEKLAKAEAERENYKAGLLSRREHDKKNRRLTAEDLGDPKKVEEAVEAIVNDRELDAKVQADAQASIAETKRLREENEELQRSLESAKAAGGGATSSSGVDPASVSKPSGYWSAEQKAEIRRMYESTGLYRPEQVDRMIVRAEQMAQSGSVGSERGNDVVPKRTK